MTRSTRDLSLKMVSLASLYVALSLPVATQTAPSGTKVRNQELTEQQPHRQNHSPHRPSENQRVAIALEHMCDVTDDE